MSKDFDLCESASIFGRSGRCHPVATIEAYERTHDDDIPSPIRQARQQQVGCQSDTGVSAMAKDMIERDARRHTVPIRTADM